MGVGTMWVGFRCLIFWSVNMAFISIRPPSPLVNTAYYPMPSSQRSTHDLLLVNYEVPGISPGKAHDLIGCEVTAAIGHRGEEPEDIENGSHPHPNHCQVCPSQARGTEVLREEVMAVLHHGSQETELKGGQGQYNG